MTRRIAAGLTAAALILGTVVSLGETWAGGPAPHGQVTASRTWIAALHG